LKPSTTIRRTSAGSPVTNRHDAKSAPWRSPYARSTAGVSRAGSTEKVTISAWPARRRCTARVAAVMVGQTPGQVVKTKVAIHVLPRSWSVPNLRPSWSVSVHVPALP